MQVSVIIPVYNREKFVEKAVRSALAQAETGEVLFVDDGSTDNSLQIGYQLAAEDSRVKVFQHSKGKNLGPAAARNVGLKNAQFEYIAFLDSDDWYLENRFKNVEKIFQENSEIDGVYEAVGYHNYTGKDAPREKFEHIYTLKKMIPPNQLFEVYFDGKQGFSTLDGMVIKKRIVNKIGYFDEELRQSEDMDFILRMAMKGSLLYGELVKPVALVGNHANRSIFEGIQVNKFRYLFYQKWFKRMMENNWSSKLNRHILINITHYTPWTVKSWKHESIRYGKKTILSLLYLIKYPKLIFKLIPFLNP
jgi:glycosyltransferase involved in cell wall biosynthesis